VPVALRSDHRIGSGTWGRLRVHSGSLRFVAQTDPATDVVVRAGDEQAIPPGVGHHVDLDGAVEMTIEFLVAVAQAGDR
jgi:tellurite resistance-related uncharacterized protein